MLVARGINGPPVAVKAGVQGRLGPRTADVIQPNPPFSRAVVAAGDRPHGGIEAGHSAGHDGVLERPVVVTNGPPLPLVIDFHPALVLPADRRITEVHQPDFFLCWREERRRYRSVLTQKPICIYWHQIDYC